MLYARTGIRGESCNGCNIEFIIKFGFCTNMKKKYSAKQMVSQTISLNGGICMKFD